VKEILTRRNIGKTPQFAQDYADDENYSAKKWRKLNFFNDFSLLITSGNLVKFLRIRSSPVNRIL
jgi:hypothetical protein